MISPKTTHQRETLKYGGIVTLLLACLGACVGGFVGMFFSAAGVGAVGGAAACLVVGVGFTSWLWRNP